MQANVKRNLSSESVTMIYEKYRAKFSKIQIACEESSKHLPKMKSTKYSTDITTHNDIIYSTECYDPQYQKPSAGQQKYHIKNFHYEAFQYCLIQIY